MRPRVCLTHLGGGGRGGDEMAPWVAKDADALRSHFEVQPFRFGSFLQVPSLSLALLGSNGSLNWFAWDNALWATRVGRILNVPSVVMIGGFDAANVPELRYGALRSHEGVQRMRQILAKATRVFSISRFLADAVRDVAPDVQVDVLGLGLDSTEFPLGPPSSMRDAICTVGDVNADNLKRKGLGDFLEVASEIPEINFLVAGRIEPNAQRAVTDAPPNVKFLGFVSHQQLVATYHASRVYLQLSRHEGFGCAVAEAMLCGCRPVVSKAGALPEVVGDQGTYVELGDPKTIAEGVRRTYAGDSVSQGPRERIQSRFSLERRAAALLRIMGETCRL